MTKSKRHSIFDSWLATSSNAIYNDDDSRLVDKQLREAIGCTFVPANWIGPISVVRSNIARVKPSSFESESIPLHPGQKRLKGEFPCSPSIRLANLVTMVRITHVWRGFIDI